MLRHALALALVLFACGSSSANELRAGISQRFLDGGAPRVVTRRGRIAADGRAEVALVHPRTGASIYATVGDEALVQLQPGADAASLASEGVAFVRTISAPLHIVQIRSTRALEDGLDLADRLTRRAHPAIIGVIPDLAFRMKRAGSFTPPPDDPRYGDQWFWKQLDMNDAWAMSTGGGSTTVVVIDDGCDLSHPDLIGKLDPGTDTYSMDDDPSYLPNTPVNNHGTSCAGLVGASTNNDLGVAGACPDCRLRCVRLLGPDGSTTPIGADVAAFQFAYDNNAAVVSNSWGFAQDVPVPDMVRQIVEMLFDSGNGGKGAVVVFAAGNDDRALGDDEITAVRGVVTVGATNNFGELTSYSNYGASLDLVAPTGTLTTDISGSDGQDPGDYVATFSGTSSACPIVAGIVGLMASAAPDKTAAQLEDVLLSSTQQSTFATPDATGHDDYYGMGAVRPVDALRLLSGQVLDAGVGDMATAPMPKEKGCGCTVGARPPSSAPWFALALLTFGSLARRRTASRS